MKQEIQQMIEIERADLMREVSARKTEGCRLVAITATKSGTRHEICYSFDCRYQVRTCRVILSARDTLPTITGIYPSAFVYENELQDIFGIAVTGSLVPARDKRPRIRVTYPFELTIPPGDTLCQNR